MNASTRHFYLKAMGITQWRRRDLPDRSEPKAEAVIPGIESDLPDSTVYAGTQNAQPSLESALDRAIAEPPPAIVKKANLASQASPDMSHEPEPGHTVPPAADAGTEDLSALDWQALEARVKACTACSLCEARTQTVFGVGIREADLLVIGEGPGAEEDRQGIPFVGPAGQLLDAMLKAINYARQPSADQQGAYIANIVKCRPPDNRDPLPGEAAACRGYLDRQIALVKPKLILAVGGVAAKNLLSSDEPVGRMRGKLHHYGPGAIPLLVTYHPAYLLRSPGEKRKAWEDLKQARDLLSKA